MLEKKLLENIEEMFPRLCKIIKEYVISTTYIDI